MAVKTFTKEELYWFFNGQKFHRAYTETVKQYKKLQEHADGVVPKDLIEKRRPSESEEIKAYRQDIYVPKTKNPITKVVNSLGKIRRSPDWAVNYKDVFRPTNIVEEQQLEAYCEKYYPGYTSVTSWVFGVMLKNQCVDPNALIAVFPKIEVDPKGNELYKPMAMLFNSDLVRYYEEDDNWCIVESTEKSDITDDKGLTQYQLGKVFYVFTTDYVAKYDQVNLSADYLLKLQINYPENMKGKLPLFKIPAQFLKQKDNTLIQESRLAPMAPHLDEAAREYSDLQAAKVMHMYPLFWYYNSKECNHCSGTGSILPDANEAEAEPKNKECTHCKGTGKVKFSPYALMEVEPPTLGQQASPSPPAGYIGRDVEIIKHQEESCRQHLLEALSSVNMQFLDQVPLNISGKGKEVDRDELNNFVYNVAEDIVSAMDKIYYWINEWRYGYAVPDQKKRDQMRPGIAVPQTYDLLPANYLMEELIKASAARKVNPMIIYALEHEYANKKFYNNPEIAQFTSAIFELDPLPGLIDDEKMTRLSNKGISPKDYVISSNIVPFVKRAIAADKKFLDKPFDEKIKVLGGFADEKIKEMSAAAALAQPVNNDPNNTPAGPKNNQQQ